MLLSRDIIVLYNKLFPLQRNVAIYSQWKSVYRPAADKNKTREIFFSHLLICCKLIEMCFSHKMKKLLRGAKDGLECVLLIFLK